MKYLNYLIEKKLKHEKITMLTAYDYPTARILDEVGIDSILVGDSYGNVKLGYANTLPVTMQEMLIIGKAVSRAVKNSILIMDMPFLSFQVSEADAIYNAGLFLKETGAQAVKIESLETNVDLIATIVKHQIPVMGHIGLTPQSIYQLGGYKIQGQDSESAIKIYRLAKSLEEVGVCSLVLEGMTAELSQKITEDIKIPTIGIGAGLECDGQVLVIDDLLGMNPEGAPKHSKKYANLYSTIKEAILQFKKDIENSKFPGSENYSLLKEKEAFYHKVKNEGHKKS